MMAESEDIQPRDIVQLCPHTCRNPMFAGCMLVVTERYSWGVMGYVQVLGENGRPGGQAFYRAVWAECEKVGVAEWITS